MTRGRNLTISPLGPFDSFAGLIKSLGTKPTLPLMLMACVQPSSRATSWKILSPYVMNYEDGKPKSNTVIPG